MYFKKSECSAENDRKVVCNIVVGDQKKIK